MSGIDEFVTFPLPVLEADWVDLVRHGRMIGLFFIFYFGFKDKFAFLAKKIDDFIF